MPASETKATGTTERREVVVVGAGPVGLSLALGLARAGREVLVLEKEAGTAEHSRAPAIWPRTQEILAEWDALDSFLKEGIIVGTLQLHDVDRDRPLLRLPLEELAGETDYPHLLILPQSDTERLLLNILESLPNAEVRFGSEVTRLEQAGSTVKTEYRSESGTSVVESRLLAGCDGAHSMVRQSLGASFGGETYPIRAALADVDLPESQADTPFPRLTTRPLPAIGIRIGLARWRLILPIAGRDTMPLESQVASAVHHLFSGEDYRTVWQSEFRLHRRISSKFASGRIVLAGDAAHLNSPVGGQGMNAGIQDTAVLVPAILEALEQNSNEPLVRYADRRQREIRQGVNRFTNIMTRVLLFRNGRMLRPMFRLAQLAVRVPSVRRRILRRLAMLDQVQDAPFDSQLRPRTGIQSSETSL